MQLFHGFEVTLELRHSFTLDSDGTWTSGGLVCHTVDLVENSFASVLPL